MQRVDGGERFVRVVGWRAEASNENAASARALCRFQVRRHIADEDGVLWGNTESFAGGMDHRGVGFIVGMHVVARDDRPHAPSHVEMLIKDGERVGVRVRNDGRRNACAFEEREELLRPIAPPTFFQ